MSKSPNIETLIDACRSGLASMSGSQLTQADVEEYRRALGIAVEHLSAIQAPQEVLFFLQFVIDCEMQGAAHIVAPDGGGY
ncbi:MAG: hypothetical protein ACRBB0_27120 [Pelagimonas sp.]|uniref:hypothetical protein n=1 Tax=Pelagimonas sp. TaxID=2073170 RepID=UPI003D6AD0C5